MFLKKHNIDKENMFFFIKINVNTFFNKGKIILDQII